MPTEGASRRRSAPELVRLARRAVAAAGGASGLSLTVLALVTVAGLLVRLSLMSADSAITPGDWPVYFTVAHSLVEGRGMEGKDFRTPATR